jgi:hypothetical protein
MRQLGRVLNVMPLLRACVERAYAVLGLGWCMPLRIILFRSPDSALRDFKIQNKSSRHTAVRLQHAGVRCGWDCHACLLHLGSMSCMCAGYVQ